MTSGAGNAEALIKEVRGLHPSSRWLAYQRIARDFGEGFAKVVRERVEEIERQRSQRAPRSKRKQGA
jgi:hypothetical protein